MSVCFFRDLRMEETQELPSSSSLEYQFAVTSAKKKKTLFLNV